MSSSVTKPSLTSRSPSRNDGAVEEVLVPERVLLTAMVDLLNVSVFKEEKQTFTHQHAVVEVATGLVAESAELYELSAFKKKDPVYCFVSEVRLVCDTEIDLCKIEIYELTYHIHLIRSI